MDDGTGLLTIGQLAKRTGITVKTLRFWSDEGLVPPADRTPAGYRLYGAEALSRLALVRTLRDLGVDLRTVQRVLEREITVADVAKVHAEALDAHIRTLRLHQVVLRAVAERGSDEREMEIMNRLAQMTGEQRRRLVEDFLDEAFHEVDTGPVEQMMRNALPDLPEDPTQQQVEAWVELAELVQDPGYRARVREMSVRGAELRAAGEFLPDERTEAAGAAAGERAGQALADGIAPDAEAAGPIVAELAAGFAPDGQDPASPSWRRELADRIATFTDRRVERYWQLLGVVNGWGDCVPTVTPAMEWFVAALRAHA